jgi:hypothetical protein
MAEMSTEDIGFKDERRREEEMERRLFLLYEAELEWVCVILLFEVEAEEWEERAEEGEDERGVATSELAVLLEVLYDAMGTIAGEDEDESEVVEVVRRSEEEDDVENEEREKEAGEGGKRGEEIGREETENGAVEE